MGVQDQKGDIRPGTVPLRDIRAAAAGAGFSLCGVARCRPMPEHLARLERWLASGAHGNLGYMERNSAKRADPRQLFPTTRTVIVCAVNYRNRAWDQPEDGRPRIASYALAKDYHGTIKAMLGQMLARLQAHYPALRGRGLVDSAPIFEKAWAVEAGLGWIGRNSLLITPRYGSSVMLGELLIDQEADRYDTPFTGDGCGACRRCVEACPSGAISEDRTIDTTKCISRLTVEPSPPGGPVDTHGWAFGCDGCQCCCPHNRAKPVADNPLLRPVADPAAMDREFWRGISRAEFEHLFSGTPLERPGLENVLKRIKAIAARD